MITQPGCGFITFPRDRVSGEPHSLSKASINYQSSIGILSTFFWAEQRS